METESTFTADLDRLTAGTAVTRYINDDEEFNYVVHQMEELGHDPQRAADALREWIASTPTWDCPNCGLEGIEIEGWAYCPRCDEANPDVIWRSTDDKPN